MYRESAATKRDDVRERQAVNRIRAQAPRMHV